ncbi:MAG: oxidoreductase [Proteobacteria bacterium]|nr:oxidoreductase [Pseudomonadota bacterium]
MGGHCLRFLLEDDYYGKVVVLTRRKLPLEHKKQEQHVIDFDALARNADLVKADDIYCCLGTTRKKTASKEAYRSVDFTYPFEIARLGLANGAEHYAIVSAVGASSKSRIFYNRTKGEVEKAVSGLGFKGVYIFRPSLLTGERQEGRKWEEVGGNIAKKLSFLMAGPMKRFRPIEAKVVAFAMVQACRQGRPGVHIIESEEIRKIYESRQ